MEKPRPGQPDPLVRLQLGFALVALLAAGMWIFQGPHIGTPQRVFRVAVSFIGVAGLIAATLLRLAKNQGR